MATALEKIGKSRHGGKRQGSGRKKGVPNKVTGMLKELILEAAADVGCDGSGKDGLKGYLRKVAATDNKTYSGLIGRVLPHQVTGEGGGPLQIQRIERIVVRPKD